MDGFKTPAPSVGIDGTIYASDNLGLTAINPDGTPKWFFETGVTVIGSDRTIYAGGDKLYTINPDGTQKWAFPNAAGATAIDSDGTIYASGEEI